MTTLQGIILGIIQGLTEFLPISSSGHLVLFQRLFGLKEGALTFAVAVHVATLIPVFILLWRDIWEMIRKPFGKLTLLVVVGTIPTVIIGLSFSDLFDSLFQSGKSLAFEFIFTGAILLYAESAKSRDKKLETTTYIDAGVMGIAQGIAILPAVSRSGLTIAGALARGLNREFALKLSFLLSIPAILGSALLDAVDVAKTGSLGVDIMPLVAGMIAAAIAGYIAIKFMMKVLAKGSLKIFSYYVFVLGVLILFDQLVTHRFFAPLF